MEFLLTGEGFCLLAMEQTFDPAFPILVSSFLLFFVGYCSLPLIRIYII